MESNFFRCLAREIGPALSGRRVQKIHGPLPGIHVFDLGSGALGRHLVFKAGRKTACLFLSDEKPVNPAVPSAETMRLRKLLLGRRLLDPAWDWPGRRIAWSLSGRGGGFLVLDMVQGPSLRQELDRGFGASPLWPSLGAVLNDPEVWRSHPHISPALRKAVKALPLDKAEGLYRDLEEGRCAGYYLAFDRDNNPGRPLCWSAPFPGGDEERFDSPAPAAMRSGKRIVFPLVRQAGQSADACLVKARIKRIRRNLKKIESEEERLHRLVSQRSVALAMKGGLYALPRSEKLADIELEIEPGRRERIELDPRLTVLENMERFFKLAAKGERGLKVTAERKAALLAEMDGIKAGRVVPRAGPGSGPRPALSEKRRPSRIPPDVLRFRSSDGFILYRGKNSRANHRLLSQGASPFDLWFHAQDGPGAHLILKLDHPGQEPPQRTMLEAAALAGLKSWQSGGDRARVICARVKDVRKIKGAPLGQVAVDNVIQTIVAPLEPDLESRLRID